MLLSRGTPNRPGKQVDDYVFMKLLGKGAYGEVFQATNIKTREIVAIKCVAIERLKEHDGLVGRMQRTEVSVLQQCNNRNVVKLLKYMETSNQCYIVLELCNEGDFEELWKRRGKKFSEKEAISYLKQILNGMKGLHELNVIHRDLKLANILIHNGVLKIADLGFATQIDSKNSFVNTSLGSLGNMAPEVLEGRRYGMLADMFSIGSIYYQLLFGQFPFSVKSSPDFLQHIKSLPPNLTQGAEITQLSKDLLSQMLRYDPNTRMKWTEIYQHPLIRDDNRGPDISRPLTYNSIEYKKVDLNKQQNADMYRKMEQQPQVTDANMLQMISPQEPITFKLQDESSFASEELKQQIQAIMALQEKEEREKKEVLEKYFQLRNKYTFLPKTFESMQCLQHHASGNVIISGFMLMKKLLMESTNLIGAIDKKKNIFNAQNLQDIYMTEAFKEFFDIIQEEAFLFRIQFDEILKQCQEIIPQMKGIDNKQKQEIQELITVNFDEVYRETLLNYVLQLQDEHLKDTDSRTKNKKIDLEIYVLDCIQYDKQFNDKINQDNFSIHSYFDDVKYLDHRQKDQIIAEKFAEMFNN